MQTTDDCETQAGEEKLTLSGLLLTLADLDGPRLRIDAMIAHFGRRAFGAALFIFAVPNLLPLPPGSSTALGLPLLLIAPQLMFGRKVPWLPRSVGALTVDAAAMGRACRRVAPWVARIERLSSRRLAFLFSLPGEIAIGLVCTLLAAVLILPIPLGNLLPAAAIVILALGLVQHDGLLALIGYAAAALSVTVLILSGRLIVAVFMRLGDMIGLW